MYPQMPHLSGNIIDNGYHLCSALEQEVGSWFVWVRSWRSHSYYDASFVSVQYNLGLKR